MFLTILKKTQFTHPCLQGSMMLAGPTNQAVVVVEEQRYEYLNITDYGKGWLSPPIVLGRCDTSREPSDTDSTPSAQFNARNG